MKAFVKAGLAALAVLAGAGCASTPQIKVGWDERADFSKYRTWAWKPDGSIQDPVWAKRCEDVLSDQLASDGLRQVELGQDPDLWAVFHARLSTKTQVVSYDPAWGYGWGSWGGWADSTIEYQVPVGTIILDLVDARLKQIVWRGRAHGAIQPDRTNEEREQKLIAILKEMFAGYPPGAGTAAGSLSSEPRI